LHLIVLLSALLASLTGFVAGERPVQRAQVELSAVAASVQRGEAIAQQQVRPAQVLPGLATLLVLTLLTVAALPVRSVRAWLSLRQTWRL